jgi:hypothetical protein
MDVCIGVTWELLEFYQVTMYSGNTVTLLQGVEGGAGGMYDCIMLQSVHTHLHHMHDDHKVQTTVVEVGLHSCMPLYQVYTSPVHV